MRTPHKFALTLALITFASILSFLVVAVRAQVACTPPPALGKAAAWKQGATVNVMIDPTFSPTQQQAIKDQFDKWKNAGGANVTFKYVDPSQAGGGATTGGVHTRDRLEVISMHESALRSIRNEILAALLKQDPPRSYRV